MSQTDSEISNPDNADTIRSVQRMMYENKFVEAQKILKPIIDEFPTHSDALYMSAVCYRYTDQRAEACLLYTSDAADE